MQKEGSVTQAEALTRTAFQELGVGSLGRAGREEGLLSCGCESKQGQYAGFGGREFLQRAQPQTALASVYSVFFFLCSREARQNGDVTAFSAV